MKSAGSNLYLDSAFVLKLIGVSVAAVLAVFVELFVVSYANPFTTTILVAAIGMSSAALVQPRGGFYLFDHHHRRGNPVNSLSDIQR